MEKIFKVAVASIVLFSIVFRAPKISEIVKASSQYRDDLR